MAISDLLGNFWYRVAGFGTPTVTFTEFAEGFSGLVKRMLPLHAISRSAGVDEKGDWTEEKEEARINAARVHLVNGWQPTYNALNDIKPPGRFRIIHMKAMMASRAYGETLVAFIEFQNLFLSPQYLTEPYYGAEASGRQWDSITKVHIEDLLQELDRLSIQDQGAYKALIHSEEVLYRLQSMVDSPLYTVAPFGIEPF